MSQTDLKQKIGELFYEILLCDISTRYNDFYTYTNALARIISLLKPHCGHINYEIDTIREESIMEINKIPTDIDHYLNSIKRRTHVEGEYTRIHAVEKERICELLQDVLAKERLLAE